MATSTTTISTASEQRPMMTTGRPGDDSEQNPNFPSPTGTGSRREPGGDGNDDKNDKTFQRDDLLLEVGKPQDFPPQATAEAQLVPDVLARFLPMGDGGDPTHHTTHPPPANADVNISEKLDRRSHGDKTTHHHNDDDDKTFLLRRQQQQTADSSSTSVSIVLGDGKVPEDDPDHSMLRFAVFEAQDLTEELKRLRDLLDVVTDAEQDVSEWESTKEEEQEEVEFLSIPPAESGRNRSRERHDDRPEIAEDVSEASRDRQKPSVVTAGAVDCKTQFEISRSSLVDADDLVAERQRPFKGFGQEVVTAVK